MLEEPKGGGDFSRGINVGDRERWVSAVVGGALTLYGWRRGGLRGLLTALAGGLMMYRGVTGHCGFYESLGVTTAMGEGTRGNLGIKVERAIAINEPPEQLYRFWRNFENLPWVMSGLESVRVDGLRQSHWVAKAPAGLRLEWDAEIINDVPNELIAWQSLEGSGVQNAGSVHFEHAPDGHGTRVRVSLQYDPPGGDLGHAVAALFGEDAGERIAHDLATFKEAMEAGRLRDASW